MRFSTDLIQYLQQKADFLLEIDQKQAEINTYRPFSKETEGRIMQKLRLDWNFHSNAIEGNSLTYGETVALLMHGVTAKGKPLKDHLDIQGHNSAIEFLVSILQNERPLSASDIRELHKMLLVEPYQVKGVSSSGLDAYKTVRIGEYKTEPNQVKTITGEIHYYANPEDVPARMQALIDWYNAVRDDKTVHPAIVAALFHHEFVAIHPFDDGNGRMTRLLMNLILMRHHFPPVVIKQEKTKRATYYGALSQADTGDYLPFVELVASELLHSLNIQLRGATGEDISELADIRKEFWLLKNSFAKENENKKLKNLELQSILLDELKEVFDFLEIELKPMNELFSFVQIEPLYINEAGATVNFINIKTTNLNTILFECKLNRFKKGEKTFDLVHLLEINFADYFYQIKISNVVILKKYYDERITESEKENIAKLFLESILKNIKQQIK